MGVVAPHPEDREAREEELDHDPEHVDERDAVEGDSPLRHALDCTRPGGRGRRYRPARWRWRQGGSTASSSTGRRRSRLDGDIRDLVEPATGAPLAKAATAGPADVDRAVAAARAALEGAWAKTPPNERSRLLHALADAIVANRKELAELETRNVGKALALDQARGDRRRRELSLHGLRDRLDRGRDAADRRLDPRLHAEGAGRRRGADRSVELPDHARRLEARARAGRRLHGRPQAGPGHAADGAPAGRARGRGRDPRRRRQRRPRRRADDGRLPREPPRRRQGLVHRLDRDGLRDHAALRRPGEARRASSSAARARR